MGLKYNILEKGHSAKRTFCYLNEIRLYILFTKKGEYVTKKQPTNSLSNL